MNFLSTTTVVLSLLIMGCNFQSSKNKKEEKNLSEKELKHVNKENKQDNNALAEKTEANNSKLTNKNYLLTEKAIGNFKIDSPIPFPTTSDDYTINKKIEKRMVEGEVEENPVYIVLKNNEELMRLTPSYFKENTPYIGEMLVVSSLIKTDKAIGVGSTIEEFIKQYPKYKIWYTYISGMYVIETKDIKAQFLLNEDDLAGEITDSGEITILKKSDFKKGAKIIKIRII
jgi:hypothetical protein